MAGTDGGIAAARPHGLLPVAQAFLAGGGVSTVAALASATALYWPGRRDGPGG